MASKAGAFLIALAAAAVDQITKMLIRGSVPEFQTIPIIPGFFNIVHAENPGVAFSMFANAGGVWRNIVLTGVSSIAVIFLVYLLASGAAAQSGVLRVALSLILGGAFGNLVDRALRGTVTDFIEVYAGSHYFPAFNAADSCITIGAVLLFLDMWRSRGKEPLNSRNAS